MLLITLLCCYTANGQEGRARSINLLRTGDIIPATIWNERAVVMQHPEGKDSLRLAHYQDKKLLILDFWATWCGSCMSGLRTVRSMQLPEGVAILPISPQSIEEMELSGAFRRWRFGAYRPFSIIADSFFTQVFQVQSYPHLVWIKDGQVKMTSSSLSLTEDCIINALLDNWQGFDVKREGNPLVDKDSALKGGEL